MFSSRNIIEIKKKSFNKKIGITLFRFYWENFFYFLLSDEHQLLGIIWASTRENLSSGGCEQHRHRQTCASAQSDQRLCYSRFGKNHIWACYKRNFCFLASLCCWGVWLCRKPRWQVLSRWGPFHLRHLAMHHGVLLLF